jgi:hypothetical protein
LPRSAKCLPPNKKRQMIARIIRWAGCNKAPAGFDVGVGITVVITGTPELVVPDCVVAPLRRAAVFAVKARAGSEHKGIAIRGEDVSNGFVDGRGDSFTLSDERIGDEHKNVRVDFRELGSVVERRCCCVISY